MKTRKRNKANSRRIKRVNDYNEMKSNPRFQAPEGAYTEPGSMKK